MQGSELPRIRAERVRKEHTVADPGRAEALRRAIPPEPERLTELYHRHVVSTHHFSPELILQLFRLAAGYETGLYRGERPLEGVVMSSLFLDPAHPRIRLSFERGCLNLGGAFLHVERTAEEMLSAGPAIDEVAECCNTFGDIAVVRTPDDGMLGDLLKFARIPMVSAGEGSEENPTVGLADLYTLFKWRPDLLDPSISPEKRVEIGVAANPKQSAEVSSFLFALTKFSHAVNRVIVMRHIDEPLTERQREACKVSGLQVDNAGELYPDKALTDMYRTLLPRFDMVYVHEFEELNLARRDFEEGMKDLRPDTMILNPDIHQEEFSTNLNDSPWNAYFEQVRGALFVRMALLRSIMVEKPPKK